MGGGRAGLNKLIGSRELFSCAWTEAVVGGVGCYGQSRFIIKVSLASESHCQMLILDWMSQPPEL